MPLYAMTILITAPAGEAAAALEQHRRHLQEIDGRGRLRFAAELEDGDGFLQIIEAKDRMEAEAIARSSPLVESGLAAWMLRACTEVERGS
jgi:uncharacterized protein YciI